VAKLVASYLVFFTDVRTKDGRVVPKGIVKQLQAAGEMRNKVIHRGISPPERGDVLATLIAVNDLLYLLDWFSGHDWAFERLTPTKGQYQRA
jgi:hypothetical protein